MILDKTGLFVLDYVSINNCKTFLDFLEKRILTDFVDNIAIKSNIRNILTSKDFIKELQILYPRGILYDNIIWDFKDYEWVLFCISKDEELMKSKQKKSKK